MNYTDPSGHWSLGFWSQKQHYFAFNQNAPQNRRIRLKMSLYANGKRLFERDSETSTAQGKAWWLTAFTPKK